MVKTIIEKIDARKSNAQIIIKKAAEIIKSGGLVIYPTETCYGIAADATNADAVRKIYVAKARSRGKPMPIVVSSMKMMEKYGEVTKLVRVLVEKFMPGPLTVVTNKKRTVPDVLNPREIAFRISSCHVAAKLVRAVGKPITATSANISGEKPIYDAKKVTEVFDGRIDMILDCGKLKKVKPSTYVDARTRRVLRAGAVPKRKVINFIEAATKN